MKKSIVVILFAALICMLCAAAVSAAGNESPELAGGMLRITEAGTYRFVGSMRGTVLVDPGQGDVVLVMDNFDLDGSKSAGIVALSGDSLTISLPDNSVNSIKDGGNNSEFSAAVYSRIPTFFEGSGSLNINGTNKQAIRVENADLTFNGGNFELTAPQNAIAVEGDRAGMLVFDDGSFRMMSDGRSISPMTDFRVNGGNFREADINGSMIIPSWVNEAVELPEAVVMNADREERGFEMPQMDQNDNYFFQQPANFQPSFQQSSEMPQMPANFNYSGQFMQPGQMSGGFENNNGNEAMPEMPGSFENNDQNMNMPQMPGQMSGNMQQPGAGSIYESAASASEIVTGITTNSAMDLTADYDNATTIVVSDDNSQVKISDSGTYVVTGSSSDGNITVKKETTGVVLVLEDLDLTSTSGATVSVNKNAEVQVIISGNVTLTDAENPADEYSTDADVADAYDGAALKAKAGSQVYITGDGTLTINGNAKNGIKGGDDSSIIIDGVTMNITAANDGINSNYDVTLLGGDFTINAADDAIHADHILTIGDENGHGPTVNIENSNEGLEGTVVNIQGGDITIHSQDDAINAANGDGVYEGELDYAFNMTGGKVTINSQGDGIDSNGDVNLVGGSADIRSSAGGGEAGIDYDGQIYISKEFNLNNNSGMAGPDGMPGGMNGQNFGPMNSGQENFSGETSNFGGQNMGPMNSGQGNFSGETSSFGGQNMGPMSSGQGNFSGGSSNFGGQDMGPMNSGQGNFSGETSNFGGQNMGPMSSGQGNFSGGSSNFGGRRM